MQDRNIKFSATCFAATLLGILGCLLIAADYLAPGHTHYGLIAMPFIAASMVLRVKVYFVKMSEKLEDAFTYGREIEQARIRSLR